MSLSSTQLRIRSHGSVPVTLAVQNSAAEAFAALDVYCGGEEDPAQPVVIVVDVVDLEFYCVNA